MAAALLRDLVEVVVDDLMNLVAITSEHRWPEPAPVQSDQLAKRRLPALNKRWVETLDGSVTHGVHGGHLTVARSVPCEHACA